MVKNYSCPKKPIKKNSYKRVKISAGPLIFSQDSDSHKETWAEIFKHKESCSFNEFYLQQPTAKNQNKIVPVSVLKNDTSQIDINKQNPISSHAEEAQAYKNSQFFQFCSEKFDSINFKSLNDSDFFPMETIRATLTTNNENKKSSIPTDLNDSAGFKIESEGSELKIRNSAVPVQFLDQTGFILNENDQKRYSNKCDLNESFENLNFFGSHKNNNNRQLYLTWHILFTSYPKFINQFIPNFSKISIHMKKSFYYQEYSIFLRVLNLQKRISKCIFSESSIFQKNNYEKLSHFQKNKPKDGIPIIILQISEFDFDSKRRSIMKPHEKFKQLKNMPLANQKSFKTSNITSIDTNFYDTFFFEKFGLNSIFKEKLCNENTKLDEKEWMDKHSKNKLNIYCTKLETGIFSYPSFKKNDSEIHLKTPFMRNKKNYEIVLQTTADKSLSFGYISHLENPKNNLKNLFRISGKAVDLKLNNNIVNNSSSELLHTNNKTPISDPNFKDSNDILSKNYHQNFKNKDKPQMSSISISYETFNPGILKNKQFDRMSQKTHKGSYELLFNNDKFDLYRKNVHKNISCNRNLSHKMETSDYNEYDEKQSKNLDNIRRSAQFNKENTKNSCVSEIFFKKYGRNDLYFSSIVGPTNIFEIDFNNKKEKSTLENNKLYRNMEIINDSTNSKTKIRQSNNRISEILKKIKHDSVDGDVKEISNNYKKSSLIPAENIRLNLYEKTNETNRKMVRNSETFPHEYTKDDFVKESGINVSNPFKKKYSKDCTLDFSYFNSDILKNDVRAQTFVENWVWEEPIYSNLINNIPSLSNKSCTTKRDYESHLFNDLQESILKKEFKYNLPRRSIISEFDLLGRSANNTFYLHSSSSESSLENFDTKYELDPLYLLRNSIRFDKDFIFTKIPPNFFEKNYHTIRTLDEGDFFKVLLVIKTSCIYQQEKLGFRLPYIIEKDKSTIFNQNEVEKAGYSSKTSNKTLYQNNDAKNRLIETQISDILSSTAIKLNCDHSHKIENSWDIDCYAKKVPVNHTNKNITDLKLAFCNFKTRSKSFDSVSQIKTENLPVKNLRCIKKSIRQYASSRDRLSKLKEIEILTLLKNKNHILQLYMAWEENGFLYLETEYCDIGNLTLLLNKNITIPEKIILKLLFEILCSLKTCHENKIIHGDVKPRNILMKSRNKNPRNKNYSQQCIFNNIKTNIKQDGNHLKEDENFNGSENIYQIGKSDETCELNITKTKEIDSHINKITSALDLLNKPESFEFILGDFNISRFNTEVFENDCDASYMAPENLQNIGDEKSDIYSLGVVIFELIYKKTPSELGKNSDIIFDQVKRNEFYYVLSKMIDPDPNLRFSAQLLLTYLSNVWGYE